MPVAPGCKDVAYYAVAVVVISECIGELSVYAFSQSCDIIQSGQSVWRNLSRVFVKNRYC